MAEEYTSPYYPVFLDLHNRLAVVVGGGTVAGRKIETLLRYGADVVVIAPLATPGIDALVAEGRIEHEERGYIRGDLAGAFIVICATDDTEVNRAVYQEAEGMGCLVNVVDVPELCNFIVPSIVQRGPLQIAISTAGAAPTVAKRLRKRLESEFGDEWGAYVTLLAEVRSLVMARIPGDEEDRKPIFEAMADSDLFDRVASGAAPSAEDVFREFALGESAPHQKG
ncbi:MAG: bifunctional precorrin-2 dehydrogenase/sirohydrochlorin ferrochelatase [Actinomycetota bacterium]|nr:bifunctional precorrin-2 dehydrogenase/sirohydrochlorin ferrochelatase [Actinomycetota bacterium]